MVAFASLDEAFNGSDVAKAIEDGRSRSSVAPYNTKKLRNGSSGNNKKKNNHRGGGAMAAPVVNVDNDLLPKSSFGPNSNDKVYADASPFPSSCDSYYRGCHLDDVDNVMDIYTGDPPARRKKQREQQQKMQKAASKQDEILKPASIVEPSDDMNASSSSLSGASPFLYDGMEPLDMPYKANSDDDLAKNSARYDRIYHGDAHQRTFGFTGGPTCLPDEDEQDHSAVHGGRPTHMGDRVRNRTSSDDDDDVNDEDDDEIESMADMREHIRRLEKENRKKSSAASSSSSPRQSSVAGNKDRERNEERKRRQDQDKGTMYALEVGIYIATGIILIFMMEQLVQIGVNIGKAGMFA